MAVMRPETEAQVLDAVATGVAAGCRLEVLGLGSKRQIGPEVVADDVLDLSGLAGILSYDPAELVLTARAGTPLSVIEAALGEANQHFAFEPFRPGVLFGAPDQTLGGMLAAGLAGPRRIQAGSVRDHVLGFAGVSGRGEAFKAGGKVVKNVTGFDLSKLMAGSWGTLAVLTEITFKVLPRPETEATVVFSGLTEEAATAVLARAMGSAAEVSGAAIHAGRALVRIEGIAASVAYRVALVTGLVKAEAKVLDPASSQAFWAGLRDGEQVSDGPGAIWRVSCIPSMGWRLIAALRAELPVEAVQDWQGGLIWLRLDEAFDGDRVRAHLAAQGGGHATLIRASQALRQASACFEPAPPELAALSDRVRAAFDPAGLLNPGRMG